MKSIKRLAGFIYVFVVIGFFTVACATPVKYLKYSPELTEENAAILSITYKHTYKSFYSVETTLLKVTAIDGVNVNWPEKNITALIPEGIHDITFSMSYNDGSYSIKEEETIGILMRKGEKTFVSCEGGLRVELSSLKVSGSYFDLFTNGVKHRFESKNDGTVIHWFSPSDKYGDNNGTFVLTDIPEKYNGKYARLFFVFPSDDVEVIHGIASGLITEDGSFVDLAKITNGSVSLPLFDFYDGIIARYSGSNTGELAVDIYNDNVPYLTFEEVDNDVRGIAQVHFKTITLSNGSVTISAKEGVILDD